MKVKVNLNQIEYLISKDSSLRFLYDKYGLITYGSNEDCYSFIVKQIIGQMLSKKAGNTLIDRFENIVGHISPENIINANKHELKNTGISGRKLNAIYELSDHIINNKIDLLQLRNLSLEDQINKLTEIKGIGEWTAEMVAMFENGNLNVFSYKDVALKNGIMKLHKEYKTLSKTRFNKLKNLYHPYESIAAIYYYRLNDDKEK